MMETETQSPHTPSVSVLRPSLPTIVIWTFEFSIWDANAMLM